MPEVVARPPWPSRIMMLAEWWSMFSTCCRLHVGSVVVDDDFQVLVTAFNGAPRRLPHCDEGTAQKDGHCLECIHSEMNCIDQAARVGVSLHQTHLYTLYRPCIRCSLSIAQVGFASVNYRHDYDSDGMQHEALRTMGRANVEVRQLDPTPIERDFSIMMGLHRASWGQLSGG